MDSKLIIQFLGKLPSGGTCLVRWSSEHGRGGTMACYTPRVGCETLRVRTFFWIFFLLKSPLKINGWFRGPSEIAGAHFFFKGRVLGGSSQVW